MDGAAPALGKKTARFFTRLAATTPGSDFSLWPEGSICLRFG
jgi:hypothetical protein